MRIALLLFLSGACALIYQTTWLREFRLVFGGSTAASAAVLAIFMGGLGAGSWRLGRRAEQSPNPLSFYATLEGVIALLAALSPALIGLARQIYLAIGGTATLGFWGGTIVRLLLASLVIGLPAFCMGGTLPAAARAATRAGDIGRRGFAVIYGLNTLGAVLGVAFSTFFLFERLGNHRAIWVACGVNLLVAWAALAMARPEEASPASSEEKPRKKKGSRVTVESASVSPTFVYISAGVAGFVFFLMELVWFRMLAPVLGGTTYTFGLILLIALLGSGIGSALYAFGENRKTSLTGFAFVCALEALCVAVPYALGDRIAVIAMLVQPLGLAGFPFQLLAWTLVCSMVVLPAALVAGYQFPMLISLLGTGEVRIASQVGRTYAWNTGGAIAGSLAGGFGLLPLLSAPGAWRAVVLILGLLSLTATVLGLKTGKRFTLSLLPGAAVAVLAIVLLGAVGPTAAWRHSAIGAGREDLSEIKNRNDILNWLNLHRRCIAWEADGIESSLGAMVSQSVAFVVNGKVDGNAIGDAETQIMLGLVGAALHPEPKDALVIGLGTGSSAGWLADAPTIERVDVVELEPAIVRIAGMCSAVNRDALKNPKLHLTFGDAREFVQVTRRQYDVIASEPSNPYRAGVASLYTKEFYEAVTKRLRPGGIFVQWIQGYEVDADTIKTIYATLGSVFGGIETFTTGSQDLFFVASVEPLTFDIGTLQKRLSGEPYRTALAHAWRVWGVEGFLSRYLGNTAFAGEAAGAMMPNTDDRTILEFAFARSVGKSTGFKVEDLRVLARRLDFDRPATSNGEVNWERVCERWTSKAIHRDVVLDLRDVSLSEAQVARISARESFVEGNYQEALDHWLSQTEEPGGYRQLAMVAFLYARSGDDTALKYIEQMRKDFPTEAELLLAQLRAQQERPEEAVDALERAFVSCRQDPWVESETLKTGLELAASLADSDDTGQVGRRIFAALDQPFAAYVGESARLLMRVELAKAFESTERNRAVVALEALEPNIPWHEEYLELRERLYEATGHRLAKRARQDLEAFKHNEASTISVIGGPRTAHQTR